jgi:hypothetical protein
MLENKKEHWIFYYLRPFKLIMRPAQQFEFDMPSEVSGLLSNLELLPFN